MTDRGLPRQFRSLMIVPAEKIFLFKDVHTSERSTLRRAAELKRLNSQSRAVSFVLPPQCGLYISSRLSLFHPLNRFLNLIGPRCLSVMGTASPRDKVYRYGGENSFRGPSTGAIDQ